MANTIERTALCDFKLDNRPVKAGQVVAIADKRKLKALVTAGCVEESDEANEAVPKLAAPALASAVDAASAEAIEAGNAAHTGGAALQQTGGLVDNLVTADAAKRAQDEGRRQEGIRQQAQLDADKAKKIGEAQATLDAAKKAADAVNATDAAAKTKAKADVDAAQAALDALKKG